MTAGPRHARLWDFPGGIRPEPDKARSLATAIRTVPLPPVLVIPVNQPGHGEVDILVTEGDEVLKGQVIARGLCEDGIAVHASSSGRVRAIGHRAIPGEAASGAPCVSIEPDGRDRWITHEAMDDYTGRTPEELLARIAEAGIIGLGGAGFPTHVKAARNAGAIDTLIINACECEPFITADVALLRERAGEVVEGIRVLRHILRPRRCLIAVEEDMDEARRSMADALDGTDMTLLSVPARYPAGAERQLIRILTGTEVPGDRLPADMGFLCQNAGTVHAVGRAIRHGEPLVSRVTTLTGAALARPGNLEVPIGTPIAFLLDACGADHDSLSRLIMGGSLMGIELEGAELPVTKTTNCLIATTESELPTPAPERPCIRCGLCAEACPAGLSPQQLYWFARGGELEKARAHDLFDCIECGACAWVCPSTIPLVRYYREAKREIRARDARQQQAEHARLRYARRQDRQAREQAREERRREERARLARQKSRGDREIRDTIQGALARARARKGQRRTPDSDNG